MPGFCLAEGKAKSVGQHSVGGHRSGWPFVLSILREHASPDGILLEDYVEQTFKPGGRKSKVKSFLRRSDLLDRTFFPENRPPIWRKPWVGIFHNPPNFPEWFDRDSYPQRILGSGRFAASRKGLRGCVALSEYLAEWLRAELRVPVLAVKHPAEFPEHRFSWEAYRANERKRIVQVGWFIRNYRAIYQIGVPSSLVKTHLVQDKPWILAAAERTDAMSPFRHRQDVGGVDVVSWLPNDEYDRLFTENIMFLEVFDASANNAIIEAITRQTPVVVNRHPAVQEYLGRDYPLFFDSIDELPDLLDEGRIRGAHEYLVELDKSDLRPQHFINELQKFVAELE